GAPDQKCRDAGGNCRKDRPVAATNKTLDAEMLWRNFGRQVTIAFANEFGLLAPGGDSAGIIGVGCKPFLNCTAATRRQLVVDISVEFVFGYNPVSVGHRSSLLTSRGEATAARLRDKL